MFFFCLLAPLWLLLPSTPYTQHWGRFVLRALCGKHGKLPAKRTKTSQRASQGAARTPCSVRGHGSNGAHGVRISHTACVVRFFTEFFSCISGVCAPSLCVTFAPPKSITPGVWRTVWPLNARNPHVATANADLARSASSPFGTGAVCVRCLSFALVCFFLWWLMFYL